MFFTTQNRVCVFLQSYIYVTLRSHVRVTRRIRREDFGHFVESLEYEPDLIFVSILKKRRQTLRGIFPKMAVYMWKCLISQL